MQAVSITGLDVLIVIFPIVWRLFRYDFFNGRKKSFFSGIFSGVLFIVELSFLAWLFLVFLKGSVWCLETSLLFAGINLSANYQYLMMIFYILMDYLVYVGRNHWGMTLKDDIGELFLGTFTNMIITSLIFALVALIIFLTICLVDRNLWFSVFR